MQPVKISISKRLISKLLEVYIKSSMMPIYHILWIFISLFILSCSGGTSSIEKRVVTDEFSSYWFDGKAEVVSYTLNQSRYGENREGHAVLIFVTEPFSISKQVKLDNPEKAGEDAVTVMKLNMIKKFTTGIYPYSMMLSTFTPVDTDIPPPMLKATMTGQEWCGHVFSQLNLRSEEYVLQEFSYFEAEGDKTSELPVFFSEDVVWSWIKMDPDGLPKGNITLLPGMFHTRLLHHSIEPMKAEANLLVEGEEMLYTLNYESGRIISWKFQRSFPHRILEWKETYEGLNGKENETTATFKKMLFLPYWQYNSSSDIILRDSLGIQ
jgi:hypothetical protein